MKTINISHVFPNIGLGLDGIGFIFGAGSSYEAGYPLMNTLTQLVVSALNASEREIFDQVLAAESLSFNLATGEPNIEIISDAVITHAVNTNDLKFRNLAEKITHLVTEVILTVDPILDHHVRFLELLKTRTFGRPCCVYIFTTNYDILFELAGALTGVAVETGFIGSVERFFDNQRFSTSCGSMRSGRMFDEHPVLTVRLIKLHGSVSWVLRNGRLFECHPKAILSTDRRVMIMPRRGKVMDTLLFPHDVLFATASKFIGKECKYISSCGFSFSDSHINENLFKPAVVNGRIRLFALNGDHTNGMSDFSSAPAFHAAFMAAGISGGKPHSVGCDLWKFSKFVELFA